MMKRRPRRKKARGRREKPREMEISWGVNLSGCQEVAADERVESRGRGKRLAKGDVERLGDGGNT